MRAFHLRVAEAVRPDFAARRAFYASPLAGRALTESRATSRLVLESARFGAVLTFFASRDDAGLAEQRLEPLQAELGPAQSSFGEFTRRYDLIGAVVGSIRVTSPAAGAPALVALGRGDPAPAVPGQSTLFVARLRSDDGWEGLVHVASARPPDQWEDAEFFERFVVAHVDRGDAMP